jgi:hypothetical protein
MSEEHTPGRPFGECREVVVGRNSKVWHRLSASKSIRDRFKLAIGHRDVGRFIFTPADRVWIFSYSRSPSENAELLRNILDAGINEIVYVSSATTNVAAISRCYEYPRVKRMAECDVEKIGIARIVALGVVYGELSELPQGSTVVTSLLDLERFLLHPTWNDSDRRVNLFRLIEMPFAGRIESLIYTAYGSALWRLRKFPCLLRPIDVVLRAFGIKWYGYVYLSSRLWSSTIS